MPDSDKVTRAYRFSTYGTGPPEGQEDESPKTVFRLVYGAT